MGVWEVIIMQQRELSIKQENEINFSYYVANYTWIVLQLSVDVWNMQTTNSSRLHMFKILMIVKPRSGTWNENFFGKWKVMCGIYALFITKCNISLEWSTKTS